MISSRSPTPFLVRETKEHGEGLGGVFVLSCLLSVKREQMLAKTASQNLKLLSKHHLLSPWVNPESRCEVTEKASFANPLACICVLKGNGCSCLHGGQRRYIHVLCVCSRESLRSTLGVVPQAWSTVILLMPFLLLAYSQAYSKLAHLTTALFSFPRTCPQL